MPHNTTDFDTAARAAARQYFREGHSHLTVGFLALGNRDQAVKVAAITAAGIFQGIRSNFETRSIRSDTESFPKSIT